MTKRKRKTRRQVLVQAALILLFCAAALAGAVACFVQPPDIPVDPPDDPSLPAGSTGNSEEDDLIQDTGPVLRPLCYNILVAGLDDDNGGSDTNILVQVDAEAGVIHATSLPRDTLIDVDWNTKKLNSAYNVGGISRVQQEVSRLLGVPVHFYITVDLDGFVELVDAIDGVDFEVPIDMDYDDPVQDLHIHFKKGMQHLNGEQALKVVRFRHNNDGTGYGTEDIGRIGTQQAFLTAVAKKMLSTLSVDSISSYATIFSTYVKTDLTTGNLVWLATQALSMGMENIHFHTLPGDGSGLYQGLSYYILDPEATLELVNLAMNPYTEPLTLEDMDILTP